MKSQVFIQINRHRRPIWASQTVDHTTTFTTAPLTTPSNSNICDHALEAGHGIITGNFASGVP